jgi:hypothetical protein
MKTRNRPKPSQGLRVPERVEKRQRDLRQLLDEIGSGTLADVDELGEQDLQLLREYYGEGEDLQALLDRLRGEGREER